MISCRSVCLRLRTAAYSQNCLRTLLLVTWSTLKSSHDSQQLKIFFKPWWFCNSINANLYPAQIWLFHHPRPSVSGFTRSRYFFVVVQSEQAVLSRQSDDSVPVWVCIYIPDSQNTIRGFLCWKGRIRSKHRDWSSSLTKVRIALKASVKKVERKI